MTKRSITSNEIKKLAALSKLSITPDEMDKYSQQLSDILDYVSQLENVDTTDIEPLLNVLDQVNDSKPDEPQPSITQKLALKNAPKTSGDFFQVPEVIKKNG
ncbi:MAG: Asp-tRNA(Asn)/Glu-tRNA(Gln) amidotransferase subunit GatC [Candidatus Marinimicrobia bacterium]|nr:Asp-tRNA(Asn)/Glu-tRNA(Gln) amidotransferase subunit GatC [Candidatus Neomarinimicrobiota bacterium]